ncbi:unnamed protein product [Rhizophagus irregularis]|nr:unnamed protein product [Rhizophagus irregularis]
MKYSKVSLFFYFVGLVLDFLVHHFDLGLGFSFLFCRALTLNLDLYFFSFFSYPGREQHCFDYFGDSNFGFFYYFDSFCLEIFFFD